MSLLSRVYGGAAAWRRRWYARHPGARRRLPRPVISVGNLVVGGSGKTPVVAAIAELLLRAGERPAILSRGYARRQITGDVVIVGDGERVLEPVERSGDEPQLLARRLRGVPVLVAAERYRAGLEAVTRFGSSVLLLDDGFQHLQLERDVDLLLLSPADLAERVLPSGALREPLATARAADAILVTGGPADADRVGSAIGPVPAFTVERRYDTPLRVEPFGAAADVPAGATVLAMAGIARPQRFFEAVRQQGWVIAREMTFRDHHWYTPRDVAAVRAAARDADARVVLTTEKDAVRLRGLPADVTFAWLPMRVAIEPFDVFSSWLIERVAAARARAAQGTHAAHGHGGRAR